MDLVRRHLFFILCGVVALGAVALGVTGLQQAPKVQKKMTDVKNLYDQLNSLQLVNRERLDAEQRRIDVIIEDRNRVFKAAEELYGYQPLVPDIFPSGDSAARRKFRDQYVTAMDELMRSLNAGEPATSRDVAVWVERIENEKASQQEYGLDPDATPPAPPPTGPPTTPAGVLTKAGARENAVVRASMAAAQRIYCYAKHFRDEKPGSSVSSLGFDSSMKETEGLEVPELDQVWFAQLGYWIQKDVVGAITAVNKEAAEQARSRGEDPWLGMMPVKEVISIRVSNGYVSQGAGENSGSPPGGREAAFPPDTPDSVFTHSGSTEWYQVMQFSVKLVMDVRDIPKLIDRLCKNSFHTLLDVSYVAVKPNKTMTGKIYGSEPTVNVVMDFETILLSDYFRSMMPDVVCEEYGIQCPERETGDADDQG